MIEIQQAAKAYPERFHFIVSVKKLRASDAVQLTYDPGVTETVNIAYLLRTLDLIGHKDAGLFREHLGQQSPSPALNRSSGLR